MSSGPVGIAFLIESLGSGGAERQLTELVRHLDTSLFSPRILRWTPGDFFERDLAGVPVTVVSRGNRLAPSPVRTLVRWLRDGEVELVHGYLDTGNAYAVLGCAFARRGVAIASHRTSFQAPSGLARLHKGWAHRRAAATVTNSAAGARALQERFGVPASKIHLIRNGIDLDRFSPGNDEARRRARARFGVGPAEFLFVCVGSIAQPKGQRVLVEAMRQVPGARALLVGRVVGEAGRTVVDEIRRDDDLAARVQMADPIADVEEAYRAADVVVVPSLREGTPNALLEAFGCERPVVAADVGDVSVFVEDGQTGWLVPPGDPRALAAAMNAAREAAPELREALARAGRARLLGLGCDVGSMVDKHSQLYLTLADRARKGSTT